MKIVKTYNEGHRRYFKIFGLIFCVKVSNKHVTKYKKYYLGGLLKTVRIFKSAVYKNDHFFYFLNKCFLKKHEDGEFIYYYLLEKLIKKVSIEEYLKKNFLPKLDKKYDNAYILNANSGEIYLFLTYLLDTLIKKDGAKNPLLIATKKYHVDMIKMICPEIPYIYTKKFYTNIKKEKFVIDNIKFHEIFTNDHFYRVEDLINSEPLGTIHYFEEMKKTLNLDKICPPREVKILPEAEQQAIEKVQDLGLNLDNFVIISPEANSCKLLPEEFWKDLISQLKIQGFDIFVNISLDLFGSNDIDYKSCYLTYSEAYALASYAKKIYSLRSGFTEFLLNTKIPMEVYYTSFFRTQAAEKIRYGFGLDKIPNVDTTLIKEVIIN